MTPKPLLCLALLLTCGLMGCSSLFQPSASSNQPKPKLYLHLIAAYVYPKPPQLILSAPMPLSGDFEMHGKQHLRGHLEPRNGKFFVHFQVFLNSATNVFDGEVVLDKPDEPAPQPYDTTKPFVCQPTFVLSLDPSPKPLLQQLVAGAQEQWHRQNPLTLQEVAEVKKKFHRLRPGMTEDQVLATLGLMPYRSRLYSPDGFASKAWNRHAYQLADREVLALTLDNTGVKTHPVELPGGGGQIMMLDQTSDSKDRLVIEAQLATETWSKETGFGHGQRIYR